MMEHRQERALFLKPPDYGRDMTRINNNIHHGGVGGGESRCGAYSTLNIFARMIILKIHTSSENV